MNEEWSLGDNNNEENQEGMVGNWVEVDQDEINSNEEIQRICDFGVDYVVQKAVEKLNIPDSHYEIDEIISVKRQVVSGMNYEVHCKFGNGEGTTVDTTFVVWYQAWTNTMKVTTYSYDYKTRDFECWDQDVNDIDYSDEDGNANEEFLSEEEGMLEGYSVINLDEIEGNEVIQSVLDFGVDYVLQEGVKEGNLPDTEFDLVDIYRAWEKSVNGIKYRFHCSLDNGKGMTIRAIFTVLWKEEENSKLVTCYTFSVLKENKEEQSETDEQESTDDSTNEVVVVAEEHSEVEWDEEEDDCTPCKESIASDNDEDY
jgi:hypothetical protein